jgi:hypothetical protein
MDEVQRMKSVFAVYRIYKGLLLDSVDIYECLNFQNFWHQGWPTSTHRSAIYSVRDSPEGITGVYIYRKGQKKWEGRKD